MPTQLQLFYQEQHKIGAINQDFCWLVENGLTREDLSRNIERRPALWSRFSGFLDKLPSVASCCAGKA